ncbi:hypothetical protein DFH09DRAFT_946114, partial [Mycena vulgaris]
MIQAAVANPPPARRLRIWQQNLNRSLAAQLDMLQSLNPNKYDIALMQEPTMDQRNRSRTNLRFHAVYPTHHATAPNSTRSLILVNTHLPSSSWSPIPLDSGNLTGIELHLPSGIIRIINVYNDCNHNAAL